MTRLLMTLSGVLFINGPNIFNISPRKCKYRTSSEGGGGGGDFLCDYLFWVSNRRGQDEFVAFFREASTNWFLILHENYSMLILMNWNLFLGVQYITISQYLFVCGVAPNRMVTLLSGIYSKASMSLVWVHWIPMPPFPTPLPPSHHQLVPNS